MTRPAIGDGRRMAETPESGSGRSPTSAGARSAIAQPLVRISSFISNYLDHRREQKAWGRLEQIRLDTFNSYECRRYREKRAAALKGLGK